MPAVDGCIAVHLRPGKSSVHVMDAGEVAFQTFLALGQAWPWVNHNTAVGPVVNLTRLEREFSPAPRAGTEGEGEARGRSHAHEARPVAPFPAGDGDEPDYEGIGRSVAE